MKRKVKFQEGGAVDEPSPRSRQLRERMEKFRREGTRIQGAERERARQVAERDTARATRIPPSPRPSSVTPVGNLPPRIPAPPRPSMVRSMGEVMRPPSPAATSAASRAAGGLAGAALAGGAALAPALMERGRATMERRGAEADARREANLQAFRNYDRSEMEQEMGEAAQRMPTPRPRPAARPAPARPRIREMSADELNEMELRRIRAERQMEEDEARRIRMMRQPEEEMGGSGNIGAASARERGEQVGPPGDYNMKRGGMVPAPKAAVKKKAGGMIAAKPKAAPAKMKKGGAVAKPKTKPMPFKKGGVIKKGRK